MFKQHLIFDENQKSQNKTKREIFSNKSTYLNTYMIDTKYICQTKNHLRHKNTTNIKNTRSYHKNTLNVRSTSSATYHDIYPNITAFFVYRAHTITIF